MRQVNKEESVSFRNLMYYLCFTPADKNIWNNMQGNSIRTLLHDMCAGIENKIVNLAIDYTRIIMGDAEASYSSVVIEKLCAYFNLQGHNVLVDKLIKILNYSSASECFNDCSDRIASIFYNRETDNPQLRYETDILLMMQCILFYQNPKICEKGKYVAVNINNTRTDVFGHYGDAEDECLSKDVEKCARVTFSQLASLDFCLYTDLLEHVYERYAFPDYEEFVNFTSPVYNKMVNNIKKIVCNYLGRSSDCELFCNMLIDTLSHVATPAPNGYLSLSSHNKYFPGMCVCSTMSVPQKVWAYSENVATVKYGLSNRQLLGYTEKEIENYIDWRLKIFTLCLLSSNFIALHEYVNEKVDERLNPYTANLLIKNMSPETLTLLCMDICTDFLEIISIERNALRFALFNYNGDKLLAHNKNLNTQRDLYEQRLKEKDSQITILESALERSKKETEKNKDISAQFKNEKKIAALESKLSKLEEINAEMQVWMDSSSSSGASNDNVPNDNDNVSDDIEENAELDNSGIAGFSDEQLTCIKNKRILFVCQHNGMCRKLKEFFPNCSVSVNGYSLTANNVSSIDFVVFVTKSISHHEYFRLKSDCIHFGVDYYNVNCVSMRRITEEILSQMK